MSDLDTSRARRPAEEVPGLAQTNLIPLKNMLKNAPEFFGTPTIMNDVLVTSDRAFEKDILQSGQCRPHQPFGAGPRQWLNPGTGCR